MNTRVYVPMFLVLAIVTPAFAQAPVGRAPAQAPIDLSLQQAPEMGENFALAPHVIISTTLMLGGVGLIIASPFVAMQNLFGSNAAAGEGAAAMFIGGIASLTIGSVWLALSLGLHRQVPITRDVRVSGGATAGGGWLGVDADF